MNAAIEKDLAQRAQATILSAMPTTLAIYLYGSVARGDSRPDSDIDLAVLLPRNQRIGNLLSLTGSLVEALGRDVNLVDLRHAGNILRKEVLQDGRLIFAQNPDAVLAWEAEAMSEYAEHRERIRAILDQVRETGIGYAR